MLYSVPKSLRRTSSTPSTSNFKLSHGWLLVIIYQRVASGPCCFKVSKGSTALPKRLDILLPFLSSTRPLLMTFLNATLSKHMVAMA